MAKKNKMRALRLPLRGVMPILLAVLAFLLDTSILPLYYHGIYAPNFTMALVLAYSIAHSTVMGFVYGITAGLLLDITTSYPVGLYTGTFLLAVLFASMCSFFEKKTGKIVVLTIIYLLQEIVYLIIAYAYTIRMEWAYFIPLLARAAIGIVLCLLLQKITGKMLRPKDVEYTRSRRK